MKFKDYVENKQENEAAGLWKANGELTRMGYLKNFPNAEKLAKMSWEKLPEDAKRHAAKDMFSRSPFKEQ